MSDAIDEQLREALDQAQFRTTLLKHLANAKLKLEQNLTYAFNGGTFKATPELIAFLGVLEKRGLPHGAVVLDLHDRPIIIDTVKSFMDELVKVYDQAMISYVVEFRRLVKARTVAEIVEEQ